MCRSQEIFSLSLEELFRLGIENSLKIQASKLGEVVAEQKEKSVRTRRLPEINLEAKGSYAGQPAVFTRGLRHPEHPSMPDWSQGYRAELVQPLYQGGKIRHSITQASLEKQIAVLNTERDKAQIKLLLLDKYLMLFELYKEKKVYNQNIEEARQRLHDIQQRRKEGMLTQNDVIRSELQLTNYELALNEAQHDIMIISQQLDIILGLDENQILLPDTTLLGHKYDLEAPGNYVRQAYENYPELKIARYNTDIANTNIRLYRANYFPNLSLSSSESLGRPISNISPVQDMFMNTWNVGLVLSYPLSALYKNHHNLNIARNTMLLGKNQESQLMQELRINIKTACIKHQEALDRVKALTLSIQQANENYRIVQNKYLNQLAILTDLLDASSVRLEAELQLTAAQTNVIYTYYQLLRAIGKL